MESVSKETIEILEYLLPGFVAAWIFYGFTAHPKPSQFERIIQALIFSLIIQGILSLIVSIHWPWVEAFNALPSLGKTVIVALLVGFTFSVFANNDCFHRCFRFLKITKETSYPSEWYRTFYCNLTYIVLNFRDGRRLYGWPIEWPSEPGDGHFSITDAIWLPNNTSGEQKNIELPEDEVLLVDAKDIELVEFVPLPEDEKKKNAKKKDKKHGKGS